jgi:glucoamylase
VTEQERWEEMSGFSPSTIASNIAALICAADFARGRGEEATARYLEDFSDFLESHLEEWTVTTEGTLVPEIKKHYIRVSPAKIDDPEPEADPNNAKMIIPNHAPGEHNEYYAREIIDVGFLELVRYGIRAPEDPLIVDSLKVVDAVLKVDTPAGPCWRRYNHDGYGQRSDGGPYIGWGRGRAWPLLTGERGHYELAAGNDAGEYIRIMERFATKTGMLPEQIWDEKDIESQHLRLGGPTGSATPLMWAHSEYIQLLRSVSDGKPFDLIPQVRDRYITDRSKSGRVEFWKQNYRLHHATKGSTLRIQIPSEFLLHWSLDNWTTRNDSKSTPTSLGVDYVDIDIPSTQAQPIVFTIYYPSINRWEGRDYSVAVV